MKTSSRYFLIYFITTLAILTVILGLSSLIIDIPKNTAPQIQPTPISTPISEKNVNILCVITNTSDNSHIFSITNFNTKNNKISLVTLPSETQVFLDGNGKTIREAYLMEGLNGIKRALSQTFSIVIDKTSVTNLHDFCLALGEAGQLKYNLPFDVEYNVGGVDVNISSGIQLLDYQMAENIIEYASKNNSVIASNAVSDMLCEFYLQKSEKLAHESSENLFADIINHFDTDFRVGDFNEIKTAFGNQPSTSKAFVSSIYVVGKNIENSIFLDKQTTKSLEHFRHTI